jgi:hypothetical protein
LGKFSGTWEFPRSLCNFHNTIISLSFTRKTPFKLRLMRAWIKTGLWIALTLGFFGSFLPGQAWSSAVARQSSDSTPTATVVPGPFITVIYIEEINVRSGPNIDFPIVGKLQPNQTAPAIGRTPGAEWVEIVYSGAAGGVGWVYAANVELTGTIPVVEPPPTATPLVTSTLNPTFVAAFQTAVPPTRLPTFTQAPPLIVPSYQNSPAVSSERVQTGWVIVVFGLIGIFGLVISSFRRR